MNSISPQLQNQIAQFQQLQQQLQAVSAQKMQMDAQKKEMERTLEELGKATGDVYKNVGSLMIKVQDKESVKTEIEDSIETLGVRITSLERQEKALREKYDLLQQTLNKAMGQQPQQATAQPKPAARPQPAKRRPSSDDDEDDPENN
jgi:prefoldin beta subunit